MQTITKLYDTYAQAQRAVIAVKTAGIPDGDISLVANNGDADVRDVAPDRDRDGRDDRAEGASTGASLGATVGGAAGLLAGLGVMAIPGIGPVVAAGWLASTALGAIAGGTAGGLIGALTQAGLSEDEAHAYSEGVRRGGTLLTVRAPDSRRGEIESLLSANAVNVATRAAKYREGGWQRFEPSAPGLTADELRQERERFRN